jgi:hypothetical protein
MRRFIAALLLEYPLARWLILPLVVGYTVLWGYLAWKIGPFGKPGWKPDERYPGMPLSLQYLIALAVWLCIPVFLFGAGVYAIVGLLLIQFE